MTVVGFDFGTTNSLLSIVSGDRLINISDFDGLPFSSVVCYEGAKKIIGREAKKRLSGVGLGVHGNVISSPKMLLDREVVNIGGRGISPIDIVYDIISHIKSTAEQYTRSVDLGITQISKAIVTIPVTMDGRRRKALRSAFRRAGIGIVHFVHEPLAALYGYLRSEDDRISSEEDYQKKLRSFDRQLMLVFDWGGGTLDLTLCKLMNGALIQIKNDGSEEVGGDRFDEMLRREIETKVRNNRNLDESVLTVSGAEARLRDRAEAAKIALSDSERKDATIYVPEYFSGCSDPDLEFKLTKETLEELTGPIVRAGINRIYSLLDASGYSRSDISLCLATGGMSNMPSIICHLHEIFGPQRVHVTKRSSSLIAEGAALAAYDKARLTLAKDIELLMARNSRMPLIRSGQKMPEEGSMIRDEVDLYCVDTRDGKAKFQLQCPIKAGTAITTDTRHNVGQLMIVDVDKNAKPFFERLQLETTIDENLILTAQAKSLMRKSSDSIEIHDLEFGLSLPRQSKSLNYEDNLSVETKTLSMHESDMLPYSTALSARSNIHSDKNNDLVPGDFMAQVDPNFSDVRSDATQIQRDEIMYYARCSKCKLDIISCEC